MYQPPNVYPNFVGAVGRVPTFVDGDVTVFVVGLAFTVALWESKVTVWVGLLTTTFVQALQLSHSFDSVIVPAIDASLSVQTWTE